MPQEREGAHQVQFVVVYDLNNSHLCTWKHWLGIARALIDTVVLCQCCACRRALIHGLTCISKFPRVRLCCFIWQSWKPL